jgi:hypothetical protein
MFVEEFKRTGGTWIMKVQQQHWVGAGKPDETDGTCVSGVAQRDAP